MRAGTLTNRFAWPIAAVIAFPGPAPAQEACPPLYTFDGQAVQDVLGQSVSGAGDIDADGFADVVVGAGGDDGTPGTNSGKVYVFSGATGGIVTTWNGEAAHDIFGFCVSGAGDVNGDQVPDVIVGAPGPSYSPSGTAGKAYVYSGATGELIWSWEGEGEDDRFGHSLADAGDVNGDGFADLIVGAPGFNAPHNGTPGKSYVYSGADGQLLWSWEGEADGDRFGRSVSGAGDFDADGFADLIVGALAADGPTGTGSGKAYVFSGATGGVLWVGNGEARMDLFGCSVSGVGDINADGFDDVVVGAYEHDGPWGPLAGKVYAFSGLTGRLLRSWDGEGGDFGYAVSGAGDVNGDGCPDVLVGAYGHYGPAGYMSGKAYVFSGATGALLWSADGEAGMDWFGRSVSGAGDVNADGRAGISVGASNHTGSAGYAAGRAYVFTPFRLGDCDCSATVDLLDFAALQACATGPGGTFLPPQCGCADFDGDGDVDLGDVAGFQLLFTGEP